ncbi:hypothetical protein DH2020_024571 [Rehmannia glutinosa]|uniref:Fungal lipase-type domain-containing protein n=1 Tax=Rehmannia glutinosa TaxID=99300 RepID=A0ABR0W4K7_REHGL
MGLARRAGPPRSGKGTDHDQEQLSPEDPRPLSQIWKQIQGENNWENLLDPINSHIRREIIRYGEMAQACYDSFDFDPQSKYCGTCKYGGAHFFERLGMAGRGYTLTRFLYATSNINLPNFFQKSNVGSIWSQHANWMGYVAVATDEAEVRRLAAATSSSRGGHRDVLAELRRIIHRYRNENLSITITGHSLGAALALLSAYDIAEMKLNIIDDGQEIINKIPVTVFSFSGPRVGNLKFKERCDELGVKVLRVINVHDKVPTVPGIIANEKFQYQKYIEDKISFPWSYAHVGVELALDHTHSPFLKNTGDIRCSHNLEAHLHLMDGYHGKNNKFCLVSNRDIALVNKSCDFLKSEYGVPPYWWQDEHKGMVRTSDGRWVLPERPRIEAHPPDTAHHFEQGEISFVGHDLLWRGWLMVGMTSKVFVQQNLKEGVLRNKHNLKGMKVVGLFYLRDSLVKMMMVMK